MYTTPNIHHPQCTPPLCIPPLMYTTPNVHPPPSVYTTPDVSSMMNQVRIKIKELLDGPRMPQQMLARRAAQIFDSANTYLQQSVYMDKNLVADSVARIEPVRRVLGTRPGAGS